MIKHLILPAGGPYGLTIFGILKCLLEHNVFDIKNIESIHAVSVGSVLAIIFALNFSIEAIQTYFVDRPWEKLFEFGSISEIISRKGLFDSDFIFEVVRPFLEARNLSSNTTMLDFFEHTHIDIHIYTVDINHPTNPIVISQTTYPTMTVFDAIRCSCAVPLVFPPVLYKNMCLVDGGIITKRPLTRCIEIAKDEEILMICQRTRPHSIGTDTKLFDYIIALLYYLVGRSIQDYDNCSCSKTIWFDCAELCIDTWLECLHNRDVREDFIKKGEIIAWNYLLEHLS